MNEHVSKVFFTKKKFVTPGEYLQRLFVGRLSCYRKSPFCRLMKMCHQIFPKPNIMFCETIIQRKLVLKRGKQKEDQSKIKT